MTPEEKQEALQGGRFITVTRFDRANQKELSEQVLVKHLPVRRLMEFLQAQDDDFKQLEMLTGKDAGWIDSLSDESANAILEAGEAVNFSRAIAQAERKVAKIKGLESRLPKASQDSPASLG